MSKGVAKRPTTTKDSDVCSKQQHWCHHVYETEITEGTCHLPIEGGSDNGEFTYFGDFDETKVKSGKNKISKDNIILEVQGQKVAGYTQRDVVAWLSHCARNGNPVNIKAVRPGSLTKDLRQYLNTRFQKGSLDHDLQNTIRDNLYLRTVPCTTRPQRDGEVNGVDYTFLTPEEFIALERSGNLLESGIYEGNMYGTPRPAPAASALSTALSNVPLHPVTCEHSSSPLINENNPVSSSNPDVLLECNVMSENMCARDSLPCECLCDKLESSPTNKEFSLTNTDSTSDMSLHKIHEKNSARKENSGNYSRNDNFSFSESEESTDDTITAAFSDFSDNVKSHTTNKDICYVSANTQTEISNTAGSCNKEMVDVAISTDQSDFVPFSNNRNGSSEQNILSFLISDLLEQNPALDLHGSSDNLDTFKRKIYRQSLRRIMQRHLAKNSSDESSLSDSIDSLNSSKRYKQKFQCRKHTARHKKYEENCTQSDSSDTLYQTTSKFCEKHRKSEHRQNCNKTVSSDMLNQSTSKFQDPFAFKNTYPKGINCNSVPNIESMTNLADNNMLFVCNSCIDPERPLLHSKLTNQNSSDSFNYCDLLDVHTEDCCIEKVENIVDRINTKSVWKNSRINHNFKEGTSNYELINGNIHLLPYSDTSLNNMNKKFDSLEHNLSHKPQGTCNEEIYYSKDDSSDISFNTVGVHDFLLPSVFVSVASSVASALPGNHYGTPKPHKEPPTTPPRRTNSIGNSSGIILPGAHPSSEGKRRRNRSNVEAMAAKSVDPTDISDNIALSQQSNTRSSTPSSAQSGRRNSSNLSRYEDSPPLSNLGHLPENWEKAYTPNGEVYFIDHSSGTSQWLDPRMARIQKKTVEDCEDDELPFGWERIDDPHYGTYYIDHVNRKTQYENPVLQAKRAAQNISGSEIQVHSNNASWQQQNEWISSDQTDNQQLSRNGTANNSKGQLGTGETNNPFHKPYTFTSNPSELKGEFIQTSLVKSPRGLGFTIVGGDGEEEEFLQIKSVVPNGPAWLNKKLQTGDVLVYVNDICVLGYTHQSMVSLFQSIPPGDTVHLQVCRGYPLPFDPDDPNTEIVTTVAVSIADTRTSESDKMFTNNSNSNAGNVGSDSAESVTRSAKSMPDLSNRHTDQAHPQRHNSADLLNNSNLENTPDILDFSPQPPVKPEFLNVEIVKGASGFGFTIADSAYGQKVKKILDRPRCKHLQEGDILVEINGREVRGMPHADVVQVLKECPCGEGALVTVQRGGILSPLRGKSRIPKLKSPDNPNLAKGNGSLSQSLFFTNLPRSQDGHYSSTPGSYRSKTPTADLYSSRDKEIISVNRPKTPLVDTRNWSTSQSGNLSLSLKEPTRVQCSDSSSNVESPSKSAYNLNVEKENSLWYSDYERNREVSWMNQSFRDSTRHQDDMLEQDIYNHGRDMPHLSNSNLRHDNRSKTPLNISSSSNYSVCDDTSVNKNQYWRHSSGTDAYVSNHYSNWTGGAHSHNSDRTGYNNQSLDTTSLRNKLPVRNSPYYQSHPSSYYSSQHHNNIHSAVLPDTLSHPESHSAYCCSSMSSHHFPTRGNSQYDSLTRRKHSTSFEHEQPVSSSVTQLVQENKLAQNSSTYSPSGRKPPVLGRLPEYVETTVTLQRQESGFGFRIVGGTEEGSQVSIGHIVPGGAADLDGRLKSGDEIISVDSQSVVSTSHHHVVQLMGAAAVTGRVTLGIRRQVSSFESMYHSKSTDSIYPFDVTVTRKENEGFGFVIISSVCRAGSTIGRIIENSPAEQCGQLHVGDRILAVNGIGISNMHHGEIVNLIKDSGYSVCLTVGPPIDDASSTASTSQRGEEQVGEQDTEQLYAVELRRSTRGFGFSIRGGKEFQNMPLFVLRIAENGPAHHNNQLQVGDQIIEINGINTKNMTHSEAIELIRQGGNVVRLLVKRGSKVPSNAFDQAASPTSSVVSPGTLSPVLSPLTNGPISQSSPRGQSQNDMQGQENYNWRYELH